MEAQATSAQEPPRAGANGSPSSGVPGWGLAVSLLTLALALVRLGQGALWADEAAPGLLGMQILAHGLPLVSHPDYLIHFQPHDARDGLWIWDGWVQCYLSAAGEAFFGRTALGARLFHTLVGALIPFVAYPLFRAISSRRGVAEAATLLTGLSVPLLIAIRQARYYPEGILLTLLVLRAYHDALQARSRASAWLALWLVLLFHANFPWFFAVGVALALHLLLLRPPRQIVSRLAAAALCAGVIVLPFALWARIWDRRFTLWGTRLPISDPYQAIAFVRHYLLEINLHAAPLALLFLAGAVAAGRVRPLRAGLCVLGAIVFPVVLTGPHTPLALWIFTLTFAVLGVLGIRLLLSLALRPAEERGWMPWALVGILCAVFIGAFSRTATYPFLRYLLPLWPFLLLLVAQSAFTLGRRAWVGWSLVGALILTNALSVWPIRLASEHAELGKLAAAGRSREELQRRRFPWWLRGFDYDHAFNMIGWRPEAEPSLAVGSPLADYLDELRHPFRGPIDAISEYLNAHKRPGDRFFMVFEEYPVAFHTGLAPQRFNPSEQPPRWLIIRPLWPLQDENVVQWLNLAKYRRTGFQAIDTPYQNREEPDLHGFRSATTGPSIVIAERVP